MKYLVYAYRSGYPEEGGYPYKGHNSFALECNDWLYVVNQLNLKNWHKVAVIDIESQQYCFEVQNNPYA